MKQPTRKKLYRDSTLLSCRFAVPANNDKKEVVSIMQCINLKKYYPEIYLTDSPCLVPEDVVVELEGFIREEENYHLRTRRARAFFSLDADDGIEREMLDCVPSVCDALIAKREAAERDTQMLWYLEQIPVALDALSETQRRRIQAHYSSNQSLSEIAGEEGVDESSVRESIERGLKKMRKHFEIA